MIPLHVHSDVAQIWVVPVTPSQSIAASTHIIARARHRSSGYSSTVILQLFCKMGGNLPSTNHIYFMMSWNMLVEVSQQDPDFGQFRRRLIWKLAPVSHSHPWPGQIKKCCLTFKYYWFRRRVRGRPYDGIVEYTYNTQPVQLEHLWNWISTFN